MALAEHTQPVESAQFYNALAPAYTSISASRLPYLNGIDNLVIAKASIIQPTSYVDVGCGDGRRTLKIASALGITTAIGVDESQNMIAQVAGIRTEQVSIVELDIPEEFDVITALWNVIGHVSSGDRVSAFDVISRHLRSGGVFMLDVNNRYNTRAYGQELVDANKIADAHGEDSGDVTAHHTANGITYATIGHVFHPDEIDDIVDDIPSLQITDKIPIDYSTGKIVSSASDGQLFYEITKV